MVDGARSRANELRELSAEELRDLSAIEYRSLEVESADLAQMDDLLNELGRERWECYHVSDNSRGRVFYFKRNKSNVIAHLTNLGRRRDGGAGQVCDPAQDICPMTDQATRCRRPPTPHGVPWRRPPILHNVFLQAVDCCDVDWAQAL